MMNHKTKPLIIIVVILAIALVVYLNRAYAHIYNEIGAVNLKSPDLSGEYLIGNNMATTSLTYVALGDSLTAGVGAARYEESYPYLVAQQLASVNHKIVIKDEATPGITTAGLLANLLPKATQDNPDVVTLLIGVNDIHNFVSVKDFQSNYAQILDQLSKKTKARVYVINLPLVGADTLVNPLYSYYFDVKTREFNELIKKLTVQYGAQYIDLYTPTRSLFKKADYYSTDLFHPSAAGYKIWADIIYADINQ